VAFGYRFKHALKQPLEFGSNACLYVQICETLPASVPVVATSVTHVMVETAAGALSTEATSSSDAASIKQTKSTTSEDDLRSRWDSRHFDVTLISFIPLIFPHLYIMPFLLR
jgi:hypothetical protein